jgi:hypothetical protein
MTQTFRYCFCHINTELLIIRLYKMVPPSPVNLEITAGDDIRTYDIRPSRIAR